MHSSYLLLAAVIVVGYGPAAGRLLSPQSLPAAGYALATGFVLCLLLSVLLHELGHAVAARHYGIGVRAITLELLGGYTELEGDSPHARADAVVSLVGPIISAVLGALGFGLLRIVPPHTIFAELAFQLAWSNAIVAVFNILPGLPLDGGRALRALVWAATGDRNVGTQAAGWVGRVVATATFAVVVLFASAGALSYLSVVVAGFVALVVWQGATAAIMQGRLAARLPKINLRQLARPVFAVASGTPLAEAIRRLSEAGRPGAALAVTDTSGRLVALVHERSAARVPVERRPWVPVESVARTLEPGRSLAVDLPGEAVVAAVQAHPAPNYLVVSGEDVVGVLRTDDLARVLGS